MVDSMNNLYLKPRMPKVEINTCHLLEELLPLARILLANIYQRTGFIDTSKQRPTEGEAAQLENPSSYPLHETRTLLLKLVENQDLVMKVQALFEEAHLENETVSLLPLEYTSWCIVDWEHLLHPDGKSLRLMAVLDIPNTQLVTQMISLSYSADLSYEAQAMQLLYYACFHPVRKHQRRPYYVTLLNTPGARGVILDLDKFGVNFVASETSLNFEWNSLLQESPAWCRRCFNCGLRGTPDLFTPCSKCRAVLYCDDECQLDSGKHQHRKWCKKFRSYMKMEHQLADFPFTFCQITTSQNFTKQKFKSYLQENELYNKGLWRRECPSFGGSDTGIAFGELQSPHKPYVLPLESAILETAPFNKDPPSLDLPLQNWTDYYNYRGFWLDSPIAGLLHYPITLYWIIVNWLPRQYLAVFMKMKLTSSLQVHIIGAEKEAEMFDPFLECARLLAPVDLHIHLFGNELSGRVNNICQSKENLTFHIHCGLYHESALHELPVPDLVVGFNAGLSAYTTFIETVKFILENKTPLYCTDYCYNSVIHSQKALSKCYLGRMLEPVINPFRSPFRLIAEELNLPRYSNAFIYCVQPWTSYKEDDDVYLDKAGASI